MITSAHSKSSNSSRFKQILQKFYKLICELIVFKIECGIFLIFCRLSFIKNFMMKNSFSEPKYQRKLNISRPIYFKKISAYHLVGLICISNPEGFFFFEKNFFQGLAAFFTTATRLIWASFFSTKKNSFILFSRVIF